MTLSGAIFDFSKVIGQLIGDLLYFPIWWYTKGFVKVIRWAEKYLAARLQANGLLIWLKNIFVPMYGQRDWAGVLISFFTRLVQIIVRAIMMIFWLTLTLTLVMLWLIAPVIIIYQLGFQIQNFLLS